VSVEKPDLTCREVVEQVTEYLDHALAIEVRNRLEQHLLICSPCVAFVDQHRSMLRVLGTLAASEPAATSKTQALALFRKLHRKDEP
jgi:predicted anti-sigma-YlaC factor YlaD